MEYGGKKMEYEWSEVVPRLIKLLRLHNTPVGIKVFYSIEEMEKVKGLRRPKHIHEPCQVISQAIQLGFTVGFTAKDVVTDNCSATVGLIPQDEEFRSGKVFSGGWCATDADAAGHHGAMTRVSKPYVGIVASPLIAERIEPDVVLMTMLPGEAFMLLCGLIRHDYKPLPFYHIGESGCSMHWVRTLQTGEVGLTLPCFAEMRFAGYSPSEVNVSMRPGDLVEAVTGMEELYKCGFRYPVPCYSIQMDAREGVGVTYADDVDNDVVVK